MSTSGSVHVTSAHAMSDMRRKPRQEHVNLTYQQDDVVVATRVTSPHRQLSLTSSAVSSRCETPIEGIVAPSPPPVVSRMPANPDKDDDALARLKERALEYCGQKIQISYFLIFIAFLASVALCVIVGVIVGAVRKPEECADTIYGRSRRSSLLGMNKKQQVSVPYDPTKPWTYYRLPRDVIPVHYELTLRPFFYDEVEAYFDGDVDIQLRTMQSTRFIIVHAKELNITKVEVSYTKTAAPIHIRRTFVFEHYDYFIVELASPVDANQGIKTRIWFDGGLRNTYEGFYKSAFKPPTGEKKYVVMTQFEPQAARRAFPCFDEPNMKSLFTVVVHHRSSVTALSNMPLESKTTSTDASLPVISRFARTPVPMSTYLVAVVVGPFFNANCRNTAQQLPVCIHSPYYLISQTDFALDTAVRSVEWLQRFFGVDYPLPKLDFVVYPEFRSMAMENWGLVSFREEALLVAPESTQIDKDIVSSVVVHELAHMWFGNLVTMDWWDDLWLNEGFASYMEYPANWNLGRLTDGEEYNDFLSAMSGDASRSTRAIRANNIQTSDDISAAFDSITYRKGCSIIRMLVQAIGMDNFKLGIQHYMNKYAYSNAKTTDLWKSLTVNAPIDVEKAMATWVEQKGFPLVTIEMAPADRQLVLRQERFVLPQWVPTIEEDGNGYQQQPQQVILVDEGPPSYWYIPIVYRTPGERNATTVWMPPTGDPFLVTLPVGSSMDTLKLNWQQSAFIRVDYAVTTWDKIGQKLYADINAYEPLDRAGLVDDCFALAQAGRIPYITAFRFSRFLAHETHPIVWQSAADHFNFLRYSLSDSSAYGTFENYVVALTRSARLAVGRLPPNDATTKNTKATLAHISLAFKTMKDVQCYARYYRQNTWRSAENLSLRRAVLVSQVISNDTKETIEEMLEMGRLSTVKQLQKSVLYAVAKTQHRWILIRELEKVFTGELLPPDFLALAVYANYDVSSRLFMWQWIRQNLHRLIPRFGGPTRNLMRWAVSPASIFNTAMQYEEFQLFVESVGDFGAGERPKDLMAETIRTNIYWRQNVRSECESALNDKSIAEWLLTLAATPIVC